MFDVVNSHLDFDFDDIDELRLVRTYKLTISAQPWARAQEAVDFLRSTLWREGRLLATYKDGRAHLNAYLDDHAFLLAALLELMQTAFRPRDLAWAIELADTLLERFEDRAAGGFFFTSHDHEALIHRAKPGQGMNE